VSFGSDVITAFGTGTYTVQRYALGTSSSGHYTRATPTTLTISASVQPVTGRALRDLREGQVAGDVKIVYTGTELRTVGPAGEADVIVIDGDHYRVTKVEHFSVISDHYRATVERLEVP